MAARTRSVQRLALLLLLSVAITAQASAFYLPQQPEEDTPVALQRAKRCLFGGWACKPAGGPVSPANPPPGPGMGPYPGPGMGPYPGPGMGPYPGPGMGPYPGPGMGPNPGPGAGAGPNPGYGGLVYKPYNHFYQPNSINNQENSHNYQPTFG